MRFLNEWRSLLRNPRHRNDWNLSFSNSSWQKSWRGKVAQVNRNIRYSNVTEIRGQNLKSPEAIKRRMLTWFQVRIFRCKMPTTAFACSAKQYYLSLYVGKEDLNLTLIGQSRCARFMFPLWNSRWCSFFEWISRSRSNFKSRTKSKHIQYRSRKPKQRSSTVKHRSSLSQESRNFSIQG